MDGTVIAGRRAAAVRFEFHLSGFLPDIIFLMLPSTESECSANDAVAIDPAAWAGALAMEPCLTARLSIRTGFFMAAVRW